MFFFFQAEDGIRDLVRSRGLGDVYKRQAEPSRDRRPDRIAATRHATDWPIPARRDHADEHLSLIHI